MSIPVPPSPRLSLVPLFYALSTISFSYPSNLHHHPSFLFPSSSLVPTASSHLFPLSLFSLSFTLLFLSTYSLPTTFFPPPFISSLPLRLPYLHHQSSPIADQITSFLCLVFISLLLVSVYPLSLAFCKKHLHYAIHCRITCFQALLFETILSIMSVSS